MRGSRTAHARRLIDDLIDRAHSEWPSVTFILTLPTGEQVLLPRHRAGLTACDDEHSGYFSSVIRPHCTADPVPRAGGICRMVPSGRPPAHPPKGGSTRGPPEYRLELRSGEVTTYP